MKFSSKTGTYGITSVNKNINTTNKASPKLLSSIYIKNILLPAKAINILRIKAIVHIINMTPI